MNTRHALDSALCVALTASVLGRGGAARADVTAAWANVTTYTYTITHVPDLDQRRFLVPNAGNMYCVPTSAVNWMAYFANHGVASLPPGMGNWQSQSLYNDGTGAVIDMGILMSTDAVNGTDGTGGLNGLLAWLFPRPFVVAQQYMNYTWTPRFQNMSEAVFNGGYVMAGVGWYNEFKFDPGGMERLGGHALSLTGGARSGGNMEIGWRDPARDEGAVTLRLLQQSIFATEEYALQPLNRKPWMDGAYRAYRSMDKVVDYGSAFLDGYSAIYPLFALASQPESKGTIIAKAWAGGLSGSIQSNIIDFPYQEPLGSITLHPNLQWVLYISDSELHLINPVRGTDEPVDYQLFTPGAIVVGRKRGVYILDDTKLICLNIDVDPPAEEASTFTAEIPGAMTYDDANDRLIILAPLDGKIMSYAADLSGAPDIINLPAGVTINEESRVAWDPATGGCWIVGPVSDTAYHVQWDGGAGDVEVCTLSDPDVSAPVDVQVGDNGRVFIVAGNAVHEFDPVAPRAADAAAGCAGGAWEPAADPYFPGLAVGGHLLLARSRTNFDPLIQTPDQWYNDLPAEGLGQSIPDCVSDIDGNGTVEIADLLALLAAWGPCSGPCYEDVDADGVVGITDFLQLLADWGPCP